jgi:hypothetical protein
MIKPSQRILPIDSMYILHAMGNESRVMDKKFITDTLKWTDYNTIIQLYSKQVGFDGTKLVSSQARIRLPRYFPSPYYPLQIYSTDHTIGQALFNRFILTSLRQFNQMATEYSSISIDEIFNSGEVYLYHIRITENLLLFVSNQRLCMILMNNNSAFDCMKIVFHIPYEEIVFMEVHYDADSLLSSMTNATLYQDVTESMDTHALDDITLLNDSHYGRSDDVLSVTMFSSDDISVTDYDKTGSKMTIRQLIQNPRLSLIPLKTKSMLSSVKGRPTLIIRYKSKKQDR